MLSFLAPWEGLGEEASVVVGGDGSQLLDLVFDEPLQDRDHDLGEGLVEVELDAAVRHHDGAALAHPAARVDGIAAVEQFDQILLDLAAGLAGSLADLLLALGVSFVVTGPGRTVAEVLRREQLPPAVDLRRDPQVTCDSLRPAGEQTADTSLGVLDGLAGQIHGVSEKHRYLQLFLWLCQVSPRW